MTIKEICEKSGLTADTLRYYERIGLIPKVNRTAGGIRSYTEYDLNWIGFIKCMRHAGIRVEALIEYVTLFQQGDATIEARKRILINGREQIAARVAEMQNILERLNDKIERYEEKIVPLEKELDVSPVWRFLLKCS
jgi:DNA-binding transcriptional MerR regulator